MSVELRTPFNYDRAAMRARTVITDFGDSLTVQSEADEADINVLVRRFGLTGQIPVDVRTPLPSDFTEALDYKDALDALRAADQSFSELSSDVRERFSNDPAKFYDFVTAEQDGKLVNLEEMRKFGLAVPAEPVAVPAPVPVNPPA